MVTTKNRGCKLLTTSIQITLISQLMLFFRYITTTKSVLSFSRTIKKVLTISLNSLSPLTPYRSSSPQFPFVTAIQTLFILPHQFSFVSSLLSFSPIAYLVTLRVFSFRFGTLSYIIYFIALQHHIDIMY